MGAGNGIRDDAAHGIIGAAGAARADAEELRRLGLSKSRKGQANGRGGGE